MTNLNHINVCWFSKNTFFCQTTFARLLQRRFWLSHLKGTTKLLCPLPNKGNSNVKRKLCHPRRTCNRWWAKRKFSLFSEGTAACIASHLGFTVLQKGLPDGVSPFCTENGIEENGNGNVRHFRWRLFDKTDALLKLVQDWRESVALIKPRPAGMCAHFSVASASVESCHAPQNLGVYGDP